MKFDDMLPNQEFHRDAAWTSLDKEMQTKIAESETGIYRYTFYKGEVLSVHGHRAANCLSTVGDWVEKPKPVEKKKVETEDKELVSA